MIDWRDRRARIVWGNAESFLRERVGSRVSDRWRLVFLLSGNPLANSGARFRLVAALACGILISTSSCYGAGASRGRAGKCLPCRQLAQLGLADDCPSFCGLREIPTSNILYLDWPYSTDEVSVELFREKLLIPILGAVSSRGIAPQIDYIVYSSDFPWSIDFKSLLGSQKPPPQFTPIGSLTSLTFFATAIMSNDYRFIGLNGNHYFRADKDHLDNPSLGFRGWYGFNDDGKLVEGGGASYVLSTMLGVTSNNGMASRTLLPI